MDTKKARKRQANFWLKEETIAALKDLADQKGWSRSQMVETAVTIMQALHKRRQAAEARREGDIHD